MNELEYQQLLNGTSENLAVLIFEKVDRAYEDAAFIDAPMLAIEIFDLPEGTLVATSATPEFNAVCNAIDFLIEEESVWFDTRDGHIRRV